MRSLVLASAAALAIGCSSEAGNRNVPCRPVSTAPARSTTPFDGTVFTIVMENQDASAMLGDDGPPYVRSLAGQGAVAAGYHDAEVHPSEPNYLWLVAGENFGVEDDQDPAQNHVACGSHLADQLDAAGVGWRAYQESMGEPCRLTGAYPYEPKHDPFVYFDDLNGWDGSAFHPTDRCREHVVDYAELDRDLASGNVPRYVFITPNLEDDMHDGSVADGDAWLAREVPKILASPAYQKGGVLFLTWDEGATHPLSGTGDHPAMIVLSPLVANGTVSPIPYDASSYLKTVQILLGVDVLPCNPSPEGVLAMRDLFRVPLPDVAR